MIIIKVTPTCIVRCDSPWQLKASFKKCLVLERMKDSWSLACAIDQPECWHELVVAALYHLDIELGIPLWTRHSWWVDSML